MAETYSRACLFLLYRLLLTYRCVWEEQKHHSSMHCTSPTSGSWFLSQAPTPASSKTVWSSSALSTVTLTCVSHHSNLQQAKSKELTHFSRTDLEVLTSSMTAARAVGALQAKQGGKGLSAPHTCTMLLSLEAAGHLHFWKTQRLIQVAKNTLQVSAFEKNWPLFCYWLFKAWVEPLTSVARLTKQALRPLNADLGNGHPIKAPMVENQLLVAKINSWINATQSLI